MRTFIVAVIGLLPAGRIKNWLLRQMGYDVHRKARIAPILLARVAAMYVGPDARIGPFNVIRDVRLVRLGSGAVLGQWNWISAARPLVGPRGTGELHVGQQSAVTSRHYLDVSGGVRIGSYSTVAGVRSTFITHGIDWRQSVQTTRGIDVGDHCLVSSNVSLVPGARVPDRSVVGMGATVGGGLSEPNMLYIQNRADVKREVAGEYFRRRVGFVGTSQTPVAPQLEDKE